MQDPQTIYQRFNKDLINLKFGQKPNKLYDPIYYSLAVGGKRIRPILCLMACELFGGNYKDALNASFGIEIFHNFTLLHDDMMDKAKVRRGKPVVHLKWNENIALLSGDAMSVIAYKQICKTKKNLEQVLEIFSDTALQICEGQQYDMDFETINDVSEDQYLLMIKLKTAVLLAASLKIGAIIADASPTDQKYIYEFGENLGMAFQLQDDILDTFGNPEVFGKNIGGDIVANKKTYLLIKAIEKANKSQKKELTYWLSLTNFNAEEKIQSIKNIYQKLEIKEQSEHLMDTYFKNAFRNFDLLSPKEDSKKFLYNYANTLNRRNY